MAIVVEDGTGLTNADAYVTEAYCDSYHALRGRTDWAGLATAVKEAAIVRATDYIELRFGPRFRGSRKSKAQSLQWPRYDANDNSGWWLSGVNIDAVPRQLEKACAEYALIAARSGELIANPPAATQALADGTVTAASGTSGVVSSKREKVDVLEEETKYDTRSSQAIKYGSGGLISAYNIPEYPLADMWLRELIGGGLTADVSRA